MFGEVNLSFWTNPLCGGYRGTVAPIRPPPGKRFPSDVPGDGSGNKHKNTCRRRFVNSPSLRDPLRCFSRANPCFGNRRVRRQACQDKPTHSSCHRALGLPVVTHIGSNKHLQSAKSARESIFQVLAWFNTLHLGY